MYTNTRRRLSAIKKTGHNVILFTHTPGHFLSDCRWILQRLDSVNSVVIRIDGSGILDKFTLLKCISPGLQMYWELHGFPQESYEGAVLMRGRLIRFKYYMRRRILSYLADVVISVSKELETFAKTQMHMKKSYIIPNFVIPAEYHPIRRRRNTALDTLSERFLVCWGGGADLPWQALDTIEYAAKATYMKDPSILFVVVGPQAWHEFRWHKNIIFLSRIPRPEFLRLIQRANICLALYHKPKWAPFYFAPLKILDYMALHKAVIATDQPSTRTLISHDINGLLTNNSPKDIAEKILLLKKHPSYAKLLGKHAGQTIMERYTIKQARYSYAKILEPAGRGIDGYLKN